MTVSRSSTRRQEAAPKTLIEAARQAGGEIRRIALTHGHGDHVGSVDALKEQLGDGVEVLMPELDARIHAGEKVVEGKLPGSWPKLKTVPDVRLMAGDRIGSLEVVREPRPQPRSRFVPRHARPVADRGRCVHQLRPGGCADLGLLSVSLRLLADLGQAKGARLGARASRARPVAAGRRARAGGARARAGDGPGDRPRGSR